MSTNDTNYNQTSNTNVNPAQVQNYITWINSHLKKRPGVKLVENLHIDITNGVPLVHLIEVISGNVLADVNLNPKSAHEYKENIDKVLKFMQANNVKIARTTSKEILDGNIKSIMRVILALAAHFKPSNLQAAPNRQSLVSTSSLPSSSSAKSASNILTNLNQQNAKTTSTTRALTNIDSMTHLVQAACVSFADVRRYKNENFNVKYVRRNNLLQNGQTTSTTTTTTTSVATSPVYKEKFNLTTTLGNAAAAPTSSDAPDSMSTAINNKTFVKSTSCLNTKSPIRRVVRPHLEQTTDEYSFSNSALLSPSHQLPIASSTILSQTLLHSKPLDDKLINKNQTYSKNIVIDNANQTNIIYETKDSDCRNKTEQLNTNSTSNSSSSVNTTSSTTKQTINNNTIVLSKEAKLNESHQQLNEQTPNDLLEVPEMLDDVKNLKSVLLNLQSLLMTGDLRDLACENENAITCGNDHEIRLEDNENNISLANKSLSSTESSKEDEFALANLTKEEQISILRSKIQQLEILNNDLKLELNQTKSESMNNYGIQSGLKSRLTELDSNILELKNEQINLQLTNQQLVNEKEKLLRLLDEQTNEINKLKSELSVRDEIIEKMRLEMSSLVKTNLLKKQIKNIADLEEIQEKESVLSGMIANRKLCIIDSKLANATGKKADSTFIVNKCKQATKPAISDEETNLMRDTLNQLRHNFKPSHPSLFLIDTLEQAILTISQRTLTSDSDVAISNVDYTSKANGKMPAPTSIGLITSSTSSINSSSSSSSNSSSVASSSANSPVLSNLNQFQPNQMCTIYSSSQIPSRLKTITTTTNTTASNIINKSNTKDIEMPIVNNAEQTNVKKIISRLLSQTNTNANGASNCMASLASPSLVSASSCAQAANSHVKKKLETEFLQPKSQANSCASSMLLTISSGSSSASASASSTHSPTSSSSSTSSISNLSGSTKCIYFKNKETTPYMTTIFKSINNVTLFDFKERIAKQLDHSRKYKFYFKSHEPEFGYLREEITNENTILPTFDNQIVAWIVENE